MIVIQITLLLQVMRLSLCFLLIIFLNNLAPQSSSSTGSSVNTNIWFLCLWLSRRSPRLALFNHLFCCWHYANSITFPFSSPVASLCQIHLEIFRFGVLWFSCQVGWSWLLYFQSYNFYSDLPVAFISYSFLSFIDSNLFATMCCSNLMAATLKSLSMNFIHTRVGTSSLSFLNQVVSSWFIVWQVISSNALESLVASLRDSGSH